MKYFRLIRILMFVIVCAYIIACDKKTVTVTPKIATPVKSGPLMNALIDYNGNLVVGGKFSNIHGTPCNSIVEWNGTSWSALGLGLNGNVTALAVYNGNLIAAGEFTIGNSNSNSQFAKWDGTTWDSIPGGFQSPYLYSTVVFNTMAVYNGNLYVGGNFYNVSGNAVNSIAKWNGSTWSSVDNGLTIIGATGTVNALAIYEGFLYACGGFSWANGYIAVNNIAKWNDTIWSTVGSGINDSVDDFPVVALTVCNGNLYAGGYFGVAGGISANSVAEWNGTNWSALGSGVNESFALGSYNNNLFAGVFCDNGNTGSGIVQWNGTLWSTVGSGINNSVFSLANYNNNLYGIVSVFVSNKLDSNYVSQWDGIKWTNL